MLIHKDRTILALNDFARNIGIPTGAKCFSLNPEAATTCCKQCKANLALREQRTICAEETQSGHRVIGYWMPLKEEKDVYVHFGVGTAEAMSQQMSQPASNAELVNL